MFPSSLRGLRSRSRIVWFVIESEEHCASGHLIHVSWDGFTAVGDAVIIPVGVEVNLWDALPILPELQTLDVLVVVIHVLHGPADLVGPAPACRVVSSVRVNTSGQVSGGGGEEHLRTRVLS